MSPCICTICQEIFLFQSEDKDQQPYALSCGHIFHNKCLVQWKANVNKCPQCRASAQKPFRLFLMVESEQNKDQLDPYALKVELEKVECLNQELKKKYEDNFSKLDEYRLNAADLKRKNSEQETMIKYLKETVNNLRKERKVATQNISNLQNEIKDNKVKLESYSNIQTILDVKVEAVEIEKYKNMKLDVIANVVHQWKRNAQYYKQKEVSDRNRYSHLQNECQKYKHDARKQNEEIIKLKEQLNLLKNIVENQKHSDDFNSKINNSQCLKDRNQGEQKVNMKKQSDNLDDSLFDDTSPLVKRMKVTHVQFGKRLPSSSNVSQEDSVASNDLSSFKMKSYPGIKSSSRPYSIFKRTPSIKSTLDIFKHFDR